MAQGERRSLLGVSNEGPSTPPLSFPFSYAKRSISIATTEFLLHATAAVLGRETDRRRVHGRGKNAPPSSSGSALQAATFPVDPRAISHCRRARQAGQTERRKEEGRRGEGGLPLFRTWESLYTRRKPGNEESDHGGMTDRPLSRSIPLQVQTNTSDYIIPFVPFSASSAGEGGQSPSVSAVLLRRGEEGSEEPKGSFE